MAREAAPTAVEPQVNFLVRWTRELITFYNEVIAEMRKVVWPDRAQLKDMTIKIIIFVLFIGAVIASGALLHLVSPHAKYPFLPAQAWHLIYEIPQSIEAGIVEELVVVALLVTALEQARTRVWVIYAVGLTLRLSYHVYYGPGVLFFLLWAAAAIWVFRRTRRITPLIVAHMAYDTLGVYFHEIPHPPVAIAALIGWAVFGLIITVIVRAIQIATRVHRSAGY